MKRTPEEIFREKQGFYRENAEDRGQRELLEEARALELFESDPDFADYAPFQENHIHSREKMLQIADRCMHFCETATGVRLLPYQKPFALRIIQSLLLEDGDEVCALFSRQSGKTEAVAVVVCGCSVILPTLAKQPGIGDDSRIAKFKDGLWVGIFAPSYPVGAIMYKRMCDRMKGEKMLEVLNDPEIEEQLGEGSKVMCVTNGSYTDVISAAPQTKIEGRTYHLIIIEECQDVSTYKIRKSIHPMAAATGGTLVKIGTPSTSKGDFYDACTRGKVAQYDLGKNDLQTYFEYDWEHAARYNPRYRRYIEKEIERMGYDSDEFKMSYRLHWLVTRGQFVTTELLDECGIQKRDTMTHTVGKRPNYIKYKFVRSDYPTTADRTTENQVASLDIGRQDDSTVLTIGKVFWDNPQKYAGETRYYTHVQNWLELQGDDHEQQYPQIVDFLLNFNVGSLIVDATGRGDPVYDRLRYDLEQYGIEVFPFIFSAQSKHRGYSLLSQEMSNHRMTYPAGKGARRMRKWAKFMKQMTDLEKTWRGKVMVVQAPEESGDSRHDDYPDGLMMLNWLVNGEVSREVEVGNNPIIGKGAIEKELARYRKNAGSALHKKSRGRSKWRGK